jgi:hypothetical protein
MGAHKLCQRLLLLRFSSATSPARSIREEIAKGLGLIAKEASFPENVDTGKLRHVFNRLKNKQADLTIFVVQKIQRETVVPDGITDAEFGFCVLIGNHTASIRPEIYSKDQVLGLLTLQGF